MIVQDPTLLATEPVTDGLKDEGMLLVNSSKSPDELSVDVKADIRTVNATQIALDIMGRPIVNTVLIGAFAGVSGMLSVDSVVKVVLSRFSGEVGDMNAEAVRRAYELVTDGESASAHVEV